MSFMFVLSTIIVGDNAQSILPDKVSADAFFSTQEWRNAYQNVPSWVDQSIWGGGLIPQWVDTSDWRAVITNIHVCSQRNFIHVDVEEGFNVDQDSLNNNELLRQWRNGNLNSSTNSNPVNRWFTNNNFTSDASHSVQVSDGLNIPIRNKVFAPQSSGSRTTPFGSLVNEVNSSNRWNGRPAELRSAVSNAISATRNWSSNFTLSSAQRQNIAEGGVLNVSQTTTRGSVASSRNVDEYIERRDYECGFDYLRRNGRGQVTDRGTHWFLSASHRDQIDDPFNPRQVDTEEIADGRHDAIVNNFSSNDYEHWGPFAVHWGNQVRSYGVREAYHSAFCAYEDNITAHRVAPGFRQSMIDAGLPVDPADKRFPARGRISIWEVNDVRCGINSTGRGRNVSSPHFSHQEPFTEIAAIAWSYRYWDRATGQYHATHQNREGLGPNIGVDGSRLAGHQVWLNNATPRIEGAFGARETRFQDRRYGQVRGIADAQTSAIPSEGYQIMNVVCNNKGADNVLNDTSGHTVQNERDYSKLVVSRSYSGGNIPSSPDFGAGSGNASADEGFYTKECEFGPDEVGGTNHGLNNPGNTNDGFEPFGSNESGNRITMMRDNVPSALLLDVDRNPNVGSSQITNTEPAYTLLTRSRNGSLSDWINYTTADRHILFEGDDSGELNLTNDELPNEYSSPEMELIHGFVNNFRISAPWVSDSERPEMFNVSYAWEADLRAPVPFFVMTGNGSGDKIESTGTATVDIIGRSHVDMGGTGSASDIVDVNETSGSDIDISDVGNSGMEANSSNSLVFDFIRSVSER